jgi:hypothetical protein
MPELQQMKQSVARAVQELYGVVRVFEHGPSEEKSRVGCGVDHAHLHFVPVDLDLASAVSPFLPVTVRFSPAGSRECRIAHFSGDEYLYFEEPNGLGQIATHRGFGSQLFRRAIAAHLGMPEEFSWREHQQLTNVSATIATVRAWAKGQFAYDGPAENAA